MFKFIENKKNIFFIIFISILVPNLEVLATEERRLQTAWPLSPLGTGLDVNSTITTLVRYLYEWGISLGGLAAFIALLIAGFGYLTSVGDPAKMKDAIGRIQSAFLGLVLLLSSWLILHTINPELTTLQEITFDPRKVPEIETVGEGLIVQTEPCAKAMLFPGPDFTGNWTTMIPGERKITGDFGFEPKSYKFCREMTKAEMTEEERRRKAEEKEVRRQDDRCRLLTAGVVDPEIEYIEGGGCTLQLFDGTWYGWGCGGPVVELFGPREKDFGNVMGIEVIRCLELIDRSL